MEENKIITGFSTDDDFIAAVNEKGASIAKDSTPEALLDALNSIGGELTFESTNESVIDVVNAESSTTRTINVVATHTVVGEYEQTAEIGSSYTLPTATAEDGYKFIEWEDEEGNKLTSPITIPEGSGVLNLYALSSKQVVWNVDEMCCLDFNNKGGTSEFKSFADAVNGVGCEPNFGLPDSALDKVIALDNSQQSTALDIGKGSKGLIGFSFAPGKSIKVLQMEGASFKDFATLEGNYSITSDTTLRQALQYIVSSTVDYYVPSGTTPPSGDIALSYTGIENVALSIYYDDWSEITGVYYRDVAAPIYRWADRHL